MRYSLGNNKASWGNQPIPTNSRSIRFRVRGDGCIYICVYSYFCADPCCPSVFQKDALNLWDHTTNQISFTQQRSSMLFPTIVATTQGQQSPTRAVVDGKTCDANFHLVSLRRSPTNTFRDRIAKRPLGLGVAIDVLAPRWKPWSRSIPDQIESYKLAINKSNKKWQC